MRFHVFLNRNLNSKRKFQGFFSIGRQHNEKNEGKEFTPDLGPMVPGRKRSKLKVRKNNTLFYIIVCKDELFDTK